MDFYNWGYLELSPQSNPILHASGTIINAQGGVWNVSSKAAANIGLSTTDSNLFFRNYGTLNVNVRSAYSFVTQATFENDGVLNVWSGKMDFSTASVAANHDGIFYHATGTKIRFLSGVHILTENSYFYDGRGLYEN